MRYHVFVPINSTLNVFGRLFSFNPQYSPRVGEPTNLYTFEAPASSLQQIVFMLSNNRKPFACKINVFDECTGETKTEIILE